MKVCERCLKAIESREGVQPIFAHHNLEHEACEMCGNNEEYMIYELLLYEENSKNASKTSVND